MVGMGAETALGRTVSIRAEDDKDVLKYFTPEMKKERSRWRNKMASQKKEEECIDFVEAMKQAFMDIAGLGGGS